MTRTIYIESIDRRKEGESGWWYTPVHQNAEYIFNLIKKCNVSCEKVDQIRENYWRIEIKGRKKNVRTFVNNLAILAAGVYNIREYA